MESSWNIFKGLQFANFYLVEQFSMLCTFPGIELFEQNLIAVNCKRLLAIAIFLHFFDSFVFFTEIREVILSPLFLRYWNWKMSDSDEEYEPEKILSSKLDEFGRKMYLVKWKGWNDPEDDTWEEAENYDKNFAELVLAFK